MARPRFNPTLEQRRMVEFTSGCGIREIDIAAMLAIDPKTLRRHFARELATGITKANTAVLQTLYRMATSGKHPAATIFWIKCRAGWREVTVLEHSGPQGAPLEILHGTVDERITAELARIAAARELAEIPGTADLGGEGGSGTPVARLDGAAEPTRTGG
jgi:hypothetical protein